MAYCPKCGWQIGDNDTFCSKCGVGLTTQSLTITPIAPVVGLKDESMAIILALALGFIGFYGIGQIYVGRVARGIGILLSEWILAGFSIAALVLQLWLLAAFLFVLDFGYWIWQIFDARWLAKEWNKSVHTTGHAPW